MPEGARVGSAVNMSGEDTSRVFFGLQGSLEDTLAFYRDELPAAGWTITGEKEVSN